MAIKNKDGTDYRLKGPNPHMKNQLLWDHFELHNMNFEEIKDLIKKSQNSSNKEIAKKEITEEVKQEIKQEKIQEIIKPQEEIKEELIQLKKEEIKEEKKQEETPNVKKINVFCLPAKVEIYEDFLYGEVKKTINFGKKFKFEAVIIKTEDLSFQFWTNAVELEKESIIYPQNFEKRWWKVVESSKKFDGFLISCVPSSITPSFED